MTRARNISNPQAISLPLTVSANITSNGTLSVGNTTVNGTFTANATTITGNVTVTGTQFVNGAVTFANSTSNTVFFAANGYIGIGKNDPGVKLHLYGPLNETLRLEASNTSYDASLRIHQNNTQITVLQGGVGVTGGGTWLATVPNSPLVLGTNNTRSEEHTSELQSH